MVRKIHTPSVLLLAGSALAAIPGVALAQEASEGAADSGDIIVTAQRQEQRLQDVPVSVTAFGFSAAEKEVVPVKGVIACVTIPSGRLCTNVNCGGKISAGSCLKETWNPPVLCFPEAVRFTFPSLHLAEYFTFPDSLQRSADPRANPFVTPGDLSSALESAEHVSAAMKLNKATRQGSMNEVLMPKRMPESLEVNRALRDSLARFSGAFFSRVPLSPPGNEEQDEHACVQSAEHSKWAKVPLLFPSGNFGQIGVLEPLQWLPRRAQR